MHFNSNNNNNNNNNNSNSNSSNNGNNNVDKKMHLNITGDYASPPKLNLMNVSPNQNMNVNQNQNHHQNQALRYMTIRNNNYDNVVNNKNGTNSSAVDNINRSLPSPILSTNDNGSSVSNNNSLQGYDSKPFLPNILNNSGPTNSGSSSNLAFSLSSTGIPLSQNLQINNSLNTHIPISRPVLVKPTISTPNLVNSTNSMMQYQGNYNDVQHLRRPVPELMNNNNQKIVSFSNSFHLTTPSSTLQSQFQNSTSTLIPNFGTPSVNAVTRKNTQEAIAKSIAEKYKEKPISDYIPIVRNAEMEFLKLNTNTHSKSTIQIAEQMRKRERQVYAFIWLMQNCIADENSFVPRGRIFAQYASSCVHNTLKPLSQASLGKLIRSVFPNLKTRRLGMRGQSKYHYCGLKLVNDNSSLQLENELSGSDDNIAAIESKSIESEEIKSAIQTPVLDADDSAQESETHSYTKEVYLSPTLKSDLEDNYSNETSSVDQEEIFSPNSQQTGNTLDIESKTKDISISKYDEILRSLYSGNELPFVNGNLFDAIFNDATVKSTSYNLKYPPIPSSQLKGDLDNDIISSLESIYYVHCNTLYQNISYLKFKEIENCLSIFSSGSISPQMYDLFISSKLSNWIAECDMIVHVSLVKFLSHTLINQSKSQNEDALSIASLNSLEQFAETYPTMLTEAIIDLPRFTADKKINIAKMFSRLLKKLISLVRITKTFSVSINSVKNLDENLLSVINIEDVLDILDPEISTEKRNTIRLFISKLMKSFIDDINNNGDDNTSTNKAKLICYKLTKSYCDLFTEMKDTPVIKIMCNAVRVSDALMSDISIRSKDDILPWLLYNNLSHHLFFYLVEVNSFFTYNYIIETKQCRSHIYH